MCLDTLYRFIFNSDYPTDKVVWLYEGSVKLNGSGQATVALDIQLDRVPYIKGCISLDDWQTSIGLGTTRLASGGNVTDLIIANVYNSELDLNLQRHANATVKYRLWGVLSENDTGIEANRNNAISKTKLAFSTDNNYPRLIKEGIAKSGETVAHNLKRIPYVDYWYSWTNNMMYPSYEPSGVMTTAASANVPTMSADEDNVYFKQVGGSDVYYYYRIYG